MNTSAKCWASWPSEACLPWLSLCTLIFRFLSSVWSSLDIILPARSSPSSLVVPVALLFRILLALGYCCSLRQYWIRYAVRGWMVAFSGTELWLWWPS